MLDFIQHCYNHCKEKALEQLSGRLNRVFSVEHDRESHKESLRDISMAYALLLRAAPLQKSSQCCDSLSEEVRHDEANLVLVIITVSKKSSNPFVLVYGIMYIHGRMVILCATQSRTVLISQTISHNTEFGKLPCMPTVTILLHNAHTHRHSPNFLRRTLFVYLEVWREL